MSAQMTLWGSHKPTSSAVLEGGPMPSDLPDGPMTDPRGQGLAHANHSQAPESAEDSRIHDIYGQSGFGSSESAVLQSSLESRLRVLMECTGSTLFRLTWSKKATPLGRPICALRGWAPRISDNGYTSWPTPNATNGNKSVRTLTGAEAEAIRKGWNNDLPTAAFATWLSPTRDDAGRAGSTEMADLWAAGEPVPFCHQRLRTQVLLAKPILGPLMGSGPMLNGFTAEMDDTVRLNPEHSRWLMGLPPAWADCAPTETLSFRKLRRLSSRRI